MSVVTELPRGNCALGGANTVLSAIERVIPIYHAGPGCTMQTSAGEAGQGCGRTPVFAAHVSTPSSNMLEADVVFGGIDKLKTTIEGALEIYDADAFFVLTGCTSGIIGDDVVSLVKDFQAEGVPIYAFETPGFLGESFRGYEIAFDGLLEQVVEPAPYEGDLVNLFGIVPYHDPLWEGTIEEFTRILNRLGLRVNTFFTEAQGIDVVRTASAAALNIFLSPWLLRTFEYSFTQRFGTPSLRWPSVPVGVTDTSAFVWAVAEALNLDPSIVEGVVESEERYVFRYFETAIGKLTWKRFAVVGDANSVIGITRFLANDYSFTPVIAIVTDPVFREGDKELITQQLTQLEYARPPKVVFESDQYHINNELQAHPEVALIVGGSFDRETADDMDAQFLLATYPQTERLFFNRTYSGYRGSLTLIEDLYDNL